MLFRLIYFRIFLKNYAFCSYYFTSFRLCIKRLSHILYTDFLLDRSLKYIAALGSFFLATPPSERQTAASLQSITWWLFGLCDFALRASCRLLSPPRSGFLILLPSILGTCFWSRSKKINTKTTFLLEPLLG
jgi:hypothetical protein